MTQFLLPLLVFFGKDLPVNKNTDAQMTVKQLSDAAQG